MNVLLVFNIHSAESSEATVLSSGEKSQLQDQMSDLTSQLLAVSKNLEIQVADNCQLGRWENDLSWVMRRFGNFEVRFSFFFQPEIVVSVFKKEYNKK